MGASDSAGNWGALALPLRLTGKSMWLSFQFGSLSLQLVLFFSFDSLKLPLELGLLDAFMLLMHFSGH